MIYEVTEAETLVRYIVCYDTDAKLIFRVMVQPVGSEVRLSAIEEEHLAPPSESLCHLHRFAGHLYLSVM